MKSKLSKRESPLRFDDGFRGGIALLAPLPLLIVAVLEVRKTGVLLGSESAMAFAAICGSFILFFAVYLVWTHLLFTRSDQNEVTRIAALQHRRGVSGFSRMIGLKTAEDWAMTAAFMALIVSGAAAIIGVRNGGLWLSLLVLVTVGSAWATVVYAFALRYLRLHAAGETISFEIDEAPHFSEFLSMAVMVSSVGAMSAGTPRTRAGLTTVRTHIYISFAFNALIVAMAVSLITGLIAGGAA